MTKLKDCAYPECNEKFIAKKSWQKYCCDNHRYLDFIRKKELSTAINSGYDEDSIQILSETETVKNFLYKTIEQLSGRYKHKSPDFIHNLIIACELSGTPIELAEKRYLQDDKSIKIPEELHECYKEITAPELNKNRERFANMIKRSWKDQSKSKESK